MNVRAPFVRSAERISVGDVIELRSGATFDSSTHEVRSVKLTAGSVVLSLSNDSSLYLSRESRVLVWSSRG